MEAPLSLITDTPMPSKICHRTEQQQQLSRGRFTAMDQISINRPYRQSVNGAMHKHELEDTRMSQLSRTTTEVIPHCHEFNSVNPRNPAIQYNQ